MHFARCFARPRFARPRSHRLAVPALAGLALLGLMARPAHAQTFNLTYSGAQFGNNASAVGTITLDPSQLNNPGVTRQDTNPFVTAFNITVSGASSGNGTFGFSDFSPGAPNGGFFLNTNGGTLDFTKQLIGQPTSGLPFGTAPNGSGTSGDFNIFTNIAGAAAGAPTGVSFFTIQTNNGSGNVLRLTSFAPSALPSPAPEPSSLAALGMGMIGLAGLAFKARRRRGSAGSVCVAD